MATVLFRLNGSQQAAVAVPTVYAEMYRSKRAMLFALLDKADAQADVAVCSAGPARYCGRPTARKLRLLTVHFLRAGETCAIARGRRLYERRPSGLVAGRERRLRTASEQHVGRAGCFRKAARRRWISWPWTRPLSALLWDRKWSAARYEAWLENTLERLPVAGKFRDARWVRRIVGRY